MRPKIGCHGNVPQHLWVRMGRRNHVLDGDPTHDSYGPSEPTTQMASLSVQPSLHRLPWSVPILYNGTPILPQKFAPSHGGIWTPSNTWFPGPIQLLNPNGSSIGAAVFAGLTSVTLTDRPRYSVSKNRPHLRT